MSHRVYLYNFNGKERILADQEAPQNGSGSPLDLLANIGGNNGTTLLMMEWGYEFPMYLHPLFVDQPFIAAPLYNGHEGGIFAPAAKGKAFLKDFYTFISRHAAALVDDPAAFEENRQRINDFLDTKVVHDYFHLDAWDVFNMTEEPHALQARQWLKEIIETNAVISRAIAEDDPSLLNQCPEIRKNLSGFRTFRELFNQGTGEHGWEAIHSGYFEDEEAADQQTFLENGKMGLKDRDGNVLIPARYDEVYSFPQQAQVAVVNLNGKYGYVNRQGEEVTDIIYDEAFDEEGGQAIVQEGSSCYLLRPLLRERCSRFYQGLYLLSEAPLYYAAKLDEDWGIIDANDQLRLPFRYQEDISCLSSEGYSLYTAVEAATGKKRFFTQALLPIGNENVMDVTSVATLNKQPVLKVAYAAPGSGKKKRVLLGLVDHEGKELLAPEFTRIDPTSEEHVVLTVKNGKHGLYAAGSGWVLPCEFDSIVSTMFRNDHGAWDTLAFRNKQAFLVTQAGNVTLLDKAGATERLGERYRAFYEPQHLEILAGLADDDAPADMLHQKGNEAYDAGDYATAIHYYELAAAKGSNAAMNDLGFLYSQAAGWVDDHKAFEWYQKGAEHGSSFAMTGLGACYEMGRGVTENITLALQWYEKAATLAEGNAHYNLGVLYAEGKKVPEDREKALKHLVTAERLGIPSYDYLGYLYKQREDYEAALSSFKAGIRESGSAFCAFHLALLYELGQGCKADSRKALTYYLKAAELGMEEAHLELRRLYLYDDIVQDAEQAARHETLAREAGLEIT